MDNEMDSIAPNSHPAQKKMVNTKNTNPTKQQQKQTAMNIRNDKWITKVKKMRISIVKHSRYYKTYFLPLLHKQLKTVLFNPGFP